MRGEAARMCAKRVWGKAEGGDGGSLGGGSHEARSAQGEVARADGVSAGERRDEAPRGPASGGQVSPGEPNAPNRPHGMTPAPSSFFSVSCIRSMVPAFWRGLKWGQSGSR